MRQIDETEYLDESARRLFGLQRLAMHLMLWPAVAASAVVLGLTFSSQERSLSTASRRLEDRLETVRVARIEWNKGLEATLRYAEGAILTSPLPPEERVMRSEKIQRMAGALKAESSLLGQRISYDRDPEALTWVRDIDGRSRVLNATPDGRLSNLPALSPQTVEAIAVLAMRRAEAERGESPRQKMARDLGEVHAQIDRVISEEQTSQTQRQQP